MGEMPSVFEFESAQVYLQAIFTGRNRKNSRYSQRSFASALGISCSMMGYLLKGQRALSKEAARSIAKRLSLEGIHTEDYFGLLCELDSAKSPQERERLRAQLRKFRKRMPPMKWPGQYFNLALHPHSLSILEASAIRPIGEKEIARIALQLEIPMPDVRGLLNAHEAAGLVRRNSVGEFVRIEGEISISPTYPKSKSDIRYHHTLGQASRALEESTLEDRVYAASYLPIRRASLPEFRRRIYALLDEFHDMVDENCQPDSVYGLSIGFFKALEMGEKL